MGSGFDKNALENTVCEVLLDGMPIKTAIRMRGGG